MVVFKCAGRHRGVCDYEAAERWTGRCPGCGGYWDCVKFGAASEDGEKAGTTLGGRSSRPQRQYISTGLEGFDKVLGGGLVAGRVVLLGGFPGTGKTRMLLTAADFIGKTQGRVIYASSEESEDDINSTAGDLGLVNDRVTILGNQCSLEQVLELAKKLRVFLVIYDSAQKFASDYVGGAPGSLVQCKAVGEIIKKYCGQTKTCAIIVNQMSGQGELKGGTELEHNCDTIMVLAYPRENDEEAPRGEGIRVLTGTKNRVGTENLKTYWEMTSEGRLVHVPARSKLSLDADDDDDDPEPSPRERVKLRSIPID